MMKKRALTFMAALALGACSGGVGSEARNSLSASAEAQAFGVAAYDVEGDTISLRGTDGGYLGLVQLTTPSVETRLVRLIYTDGREIEKEITRPIDGRFVAPVASDLDGAILADPQLASLFGRHALRFVVRPAADPSHGTLDPSDTASCFMIEFVPACVPCGCYNTYRDFTQDFIYTGTTRNAHCDPKACGVRDVVAKQVDCVDPGSCTFSALGLQYCSDGNNC